MEITSEKLKKTIRELDALTPSTPPIRKNKKGEPRKPKVFEVRDDFLNFSPLSQKLLYHEGQKIFYHYNNLYYSPLTEEGMFTIIDYFIVSSYKGTMDVTTANIKEVYNSLTRLASSPLQNFRKVEKDFLPTLSSFDDGVFDFANPTLPLQPHDPSLPSFHRFSFPFPTKDTAPSTPHFDKYLETTYVKEDGTPDPEFADFMLTILAYYTSPLTPPNPIAAVLVGSGSNGKSIFLDLLRAIVGNGFIASVTMEDLSGRFGASALVGKTLNLVSEDQSKYIDAGKIKALISQEYIQLERKFENPGTFKPNAKHLYSTNKELKFSDIDYATTRRIATVPYHRTFMPPGSEFIDGNLVMPIDDDLIDQVMPNVFKGKLVKELPGIFFKMLERLRSKPPLVFPNAVKIKQREVESASTTALDFFHELYVFDSKHTELVSTTQIYDEYNIWYDKNFSSDKYKMNARNFWSIITKNYPATKTSNKVYSATLNKTTAARKNIKPIIEVPYV